MSYCGACGGFYSPDCVRRADSVCTPAPNPHERATALILAAVAEANARMAVMATDNMGLMRADQPPQWTHMDFDAVCQPIRAAIAAAEAL